MLYEVGGVGYKVWSNLLCKISQTREDFIIYTAAFWFVRLQNFAGDSLCCRCVVVSVVVLTGCCASSMGTRLAFGSALKWSQHQSPTLPLCTAKRVPPVATKNRVVMTHELKTSQPQVISIDCTDTIMKVKGSIPR